MELIHSIFTGIKIGISAIISCISLIPEFIQAIANAL